MMKKVLKKYTLLVVVVTFLIGVVSCEKDFKNIGVDIVDNNVFSSDSYEALVKGYHENIEKNLTSDMDYYMLGYYKNDVFGSITSSIAGQLTIADGVNPEYGSNAVIDSVVLIIPYLSTLKGRVTVDDPANPGTTIEVNNYVLDSLYTDGSSDIMLNVYELGTYLNDLDPTNPYVAMSYYNNQLIEKTGQALYSGLLKPSSSDTVLYINRSKYVDHTLTDREVYKRDTIKLDKEVPFISVSLDKAIIKQKFQDNALTDVFSSNSDFQHYFRGLMIEAIPTSTGQALMYLKMADAKMNIYYTSNEIQDEAAGEDLNGNGIEGEANVVVPESSFFTYPFKGKTVNLYQRDYTGATAESYINSPNITAGDDKLFIHGAAGADGIIHLFGDDTNTNGVPDEIETLRNNQWLINDAQLYLYVDKSQNLKYYPERLYLYRIEDEKNYQPYDLLSQGLGNIDVAYDLISGYLVYDSNEQPDYYLFHITDYVSEILKQDSEVVITDFGVKVFDDADTFNPTASIDTLMSKHNNNFKGVVLHGNDSKAGDRRLKLKIHYTLLN